MKMSAKITSGHQHHEIAVETNGASKTIHMPVKPSGYGSAVNGGELLLLALATCYCNDLYREAAKQHIQVQGIEVECLGDFGAEGEPGDNFRYQVNLTSDASEEAIEALIRATDKVAEVHNTLRKGASVKLVR